MKKKLLRIVCLNVLILVTIQIATAANQNNNINNGFGNIFELMIEYNNKFATCTPMPSNDSVKVLGIKNGKCHFYSGFVEVANNRQPLSECFVPMDVLRQEMQKQNEMLAKGILQYDSNNDPFAPYCVKLHGTIKTDYGSMSY